MQSLLAQTRSIDLNARHGAILALGEIIYALSLIDGIVIGEFSIKFSFIQGNINHTKLNLFEMWPIFRNHRLPSPPNGGSTDHDLSVGM